MTNSRGEIVWVYGSSGAGKEFFIRKILQEKSADLRERYLRGGKVDVTFVRQASANGNLTLEIM